MLKQVRQGSDPKYVRTFLSIAQRSDGTKASTFDITINIETPRFKTNNIKT